MNIPRAARAACVSTSLLVLGCVAPGCGANDVPRHTDELHDDATWRGTHRISGQFVVDGVDLTVGCGARLQMSPGASIVVADGGRLRLEGEDDCPVTVTSDTPTPRTGDWKRILVREGRLEARHAWFAYGGAEGATVRATGEGTLDLHDVEFRSTTGPALRLDEGAELRRASHLAFRAVRGPATSTPAEALDALETPRVDDDTGPFHVHGGLVATATEWNVGAHDVRVDEPLDVRAPLTVGAGTTVELATEDPIRVHRGGRLRTLGRQPSEELDVDRRVRLASSRTSEGVRIRFAGSARDGNLLRWTHVDNAREGGRAIVVARGVDVAFDHVSFSHPQKCPIGGPGLLTGNTSSPPECTGEQQTTPADRTANGGD